MTENGVLVNYSEYGNNTIIESVELEFIDDTKMTIECDAENKQVSLTMSDMISDNTELEGTLSYDKLSVLIRILSQLRNQIK